ncbi:hypothetical protein K0M31_010101 [Melipona bicolor]|uniref:Uncharacterized protein n=1 Tax=Melipona bicolor TaxID=60889 RepID=A0AA40FMG1_9HYME|nr:hypothetical protein K0M31_010101 [Melipona bicolor]
MEQDPSETTAFDVWKLKQVDMPMDIDLTERGPRLDYGQSLVNFCNETASLRRWNRVRLSQHDHQFSSSMISSDDED